MTPLLAALFAEDFRLDANAPVQRLMFHPVPLDLAPPALPAQRESVASADTAPADPMATVLALLHEQKVTMERLEGEVKARSLMVGA